MVETNTVENLLVDLLSSLKAKERTYADVIEAWRTSCPRLPVWEEANDRGLVQVDASSMVRVTPKGEAVLQLRLMIGAWKVMVGRIPGNLIVHAEGVASMFGQVPNPFLNVSVIEREVTPEAIALLRERARLCPFPSIGVCDASAVGKGSAVENGGFGVASNLTGMATERLLPPRRAVPALDIRRVSDDATARELAMINGRAYGMPLDTFDCMCNMNLWHNDSYGFVGYANGEAVSCAATFPVNGTVYVALVATNPEAQGKGYAEAVMRHAIEAGVKGMRFTRVTLHATDMGRPLYAAMGFAESAKLGILMAAAEAAAAH